MSDFIAKAASLEKEENWEEAFDFYNKALNVL
jgi:hypothetical protein